MASVARSNNYSIKTQDSTTIASGIATIGTGYLVLTSESGTTDSVTQFTLDTDVQSTIVSDKGIWFYVTAVATHTITLVHDGSNIKSNTGADVVITANQMALCFISPSNVVNIMTTTSSSGGGTFTSITVTGTSTLGVVNASDLVTVTKTTEQLRLRYDVSNYASFTVSSGGNLTIAPSGSDTSITGTLGVSSLLTVTRTTEQLRLAYDGSNYAPFTVSSGGDLTIAPTGLDTNITGRLNVTGDVLIDTNVGYFDTTNNFFGINTTPTSILHVAGSITGAHGISIAPTVTLATANLAGFNFAPAITLSANVNTNGMRIVPSLILSQISANWFGNYVSPIISGGAYNLTNFYADYVLARTGASYTNTIGSLYGSYIATPTRAGGGTTTNAYGQYIEAQTLGTNNYGLYIETPTGTIARALHVAGAESYFGAEISLAEMGSAPANPTVSAQVKVYMKADKFIISYDNAGTMKYRYLDLTSTDATWTYTTSAP